MPNVSVKRQVQTRGFVHANQIRGGFDSIADDTLSMSDAVSLAVSAGVKKVLFTGHASVTDYLTLPSGISLCGTGPTSSHLAPHFAASGKGRVIGNDFTNGNSDIVLRDFSMDLSGTNVEHGIMLNGVDGLLIEGVYIYGQQSVAAGAICVSGILPGPLGGDPGELFDRLLSKNVRILGCAVKAGNNFAVQLGRVLGAAVGGCVFEDCYREVIGVEPEGGDTARNVAIVGNTITSDTVRIGSSTGILILTESSGGTIIGCSVVGNTIETLTPTAANGIAGILSLGGTGVVINSNTIRGVNGPGVQLGNASWTTQGIIVSDNNILDCNAGANASPNGAGIELRNAFHCRIADNYIKGANHTASVEETSGSTNNAIVDNTLRDAVQTVVLDTSKTAVWGNKATADDSVFRALAGVTVGSDTKLNPNLIMNGTGTLSRKGQIGGVDRWIETISGTEAGANAGSDFAIQARSDAGANIGTVAFFKRSAAALLPVVYPLNTTGLTSAQIDSALPTTARDGMIIHDATNHLLLARHGGAWYKTAALTAV